MFEFDKECYFDLYAKAKTVPLTIERVNEYIVFISNYINEQRTIINHLESQGKDTTAYEYKVNKALYALGLGEKPKPYWIKGERMN